ncbi:MAG TPA: hypothetical protein PLE54_07015 [Burkholderiaceae bacterium]|nr:hypothetical protein [Burkholderiaceae bacterium]HQR70336.1 hypothetical protein [Burkholderiaceae bacterium]
MKLKLWLRNLSVSAPRVAVRTQLPWALRALVLLVVASIAAAGVVAVYRYARDSGAPGRDAIVSELDATQAQLQRLVAERDRLAAESVQTENQLRVERATREGIAVQLKALEEDNARLKADLAFFESLLPAASAERGVVIRSFKLQPEPDEGMVRYRLLVQQSGRPERDFLGAVALKVSLQKDGRAMVLQLPDPALPEAGPAPLAFRHYQRLEGSFAVPPGMAVRSVQVTISAGGETRAQQTFSM